MAIKVNKANAMLFILRHVLDIKTLRSVSCAIFESNICYASFVWAQNSFHNSTVKRLHLLKKKPQDYVLSKVKSSYRSFI